VRDDGAVDAYLTRIGAVRPRRLDASALRELHRAHLLAVPFENLSIHLGQTISLDPDDLFAKIVLRRRGGFCYELNGMFGLLLESLGAQVSRVGAGVYGSDGLGMPLAHMALVVRLPDGSGPWLTDIGFGDHSDYPLLLDSDADQGDPSGTFRLAAADPEGDLDVLRDGIPQYRVERRARALRDFIPTCWWQQTAPESHFTQSTICSRRTEGGRVTISGRTLVTTEGGQRTEELLPDDAATLASYQDNFGIVLDSPPRNP
jgi:N-hydroxyarylamine O-acetyltransferase